MKQLLEINGIWTNMYYNIVASRTSDNCGVEWALKCQIWTPNRAGTLTETSREHFIGDNIFPSVRCLEELNISVQLHTNIRKLSDIKSHFCSHFNEYFISLLVSQLEFRFPLVFSYPARTRLRVQEPNIAPISYALSNSSALMLDLVSITEKQPTNTTIYQLITYRKDNEVYKLYPLDI